MSQINFGHVKNFVALQAKLIAELNRCFASPLQDAPKRGRFKLSEYTWCFKKHGMGFRFLRLQSPRIIIEAHEYLSNSGVIDAWRMLLYLESLGLKPEAELIDLYLYEQCRAGLLFPLGSRSYELVPLE
ncbi:DUF6896 domain-containing protein [Asticcacaulis benevestitus]|uniref:DUF6896 domain-containing protein n=1 Tax=Asticcacaulis benevestitus DSM 16100 = ATCC BAA-896 TaxID=1121022 RepID=V4RGD2_9CAUL|nr:hypothetical protein [Asticcacaulis benevestitus]ESQ90408.1 hypothetical protein ABENE_12520 [Asticcacaulis benevestitus DSM 16100 = ATCC BAA-896]